MELAGLIDGDTDWVLVSWHKVSKCHTELTKPVLGSYLFFNKNEKFHDKLRFSKTIVVTTP